MPRPTMLKKLKLKGSMKTYKTFYFLFFFKFIYLFFICSEFLELTPKKDILFIIGDWNAKVGSQETPGVTGKFDLGVQNEAG